MNAFTLRIARRTRMRVPNRRRAGPAFLLALLPVCGACSPAYRSELRTFGPDGDLTQATTEVGGQVISEVRRHFAETTIRGEGRIQNENEGLARRAATQLAVAELAANVQTEVRANTRIYNNSEIRDVVETRVSALVQNYQIESAGFEDDWYVVRVVLSGRRLVEEFERHLE